MIRTFIAIDIPETVKSLIAKAQNDLRQFPGNRISWTRSEGIHLTLKFLGDVVEDSITDIAEAVGTAVEQSSPFNITTTITGGFPNMRKPRVLWLGVDGGDELFRLQKAIDRNLSKLGFPREKKRFHPHLTVGRVKLLAPRSELPERFGSFVFNAIEWKAEEVRVLKSELRSSGAVYSVLEITRL